MRAKEYISLHRQDLKYADIVSQIIKDLLPLRANKEATDEYMNRYLSADTRYKQYLLQKELFERGNAMQPIDPTFEEIEGEIPMNIAADVREELFHVIREDGSFGYLFYILGTEQNSRHNSEPIDCIPNAERIVQCITRNRDDYPQKNLDGFINEDLNYQQYNLLMDGRYWNDDDALYLNYFNRVYEIFDELRLRKGSISGIRNFLQDLVFETEVEKYWVLEFIITLINEEDEDDSDLRRCQKEIERLTEPIKESIVKTNSDIKVESPVFINPRKGMKIDLIRVFDTLYELGCFTGKNGEPVLKKDFMTAMGKAINVDLSNYDSDLSRALSDSTKLDKHLRIFNEMHQKMTDIFNMH